MNTATIRFLTAALVLGCLLWIAGCGPSVPTTAQVRNLSRPGAADFSVGEQFEVVVTGEPNQAVIGAASQNGAVMARSSFGRTDKNGRFTLTGSMGPDNIGTWKEQWQVGELKAPPIEFQVKAAAK